MRVTDCSVEKFFLVAINSDVSLSAFAVEPLRDVVITADHVLPFCVQRAPNELRWNARALLAVSPDKRRHHLHSATRGFCYDLNRILILRSNPTGPT